MSRGLLVASVLCKPKVTRGRDLRLFNGIGLRPFVADVVGWTGDDCVYVYEQPQSPRNFTIEDFDHVALLYTKTSWPQCPDASGGQTARHSGDGAAKGLIDGGFARAGGAGVTNFCTPRVLVPHPCWVHAKFEINNSFFWLQPLMEHLAATLSMLDQPLYRRCISG